MLSLMPAARALFIVIGVLFCFTFNDYFFLIFMAEINFKTTR